jgi:tRNA pseudouridine38-40 synthase
MRNLKMIIEYDGTDYHGWQKQRGQVTIQQILEESISSITQENVKMIGSGRTDAGVHALNQVANFFTDSRIGERNLLAGINSVLPWDIVVREITEVDPAFHARYDAKSKVYRYRIFNGSERSAIHRRYAWFVRGPLNLGRMKEGAMLLCGCHDFSSFCAAGCTAKSHVRTVKKIEIWLDGASILNIEVEADGFLRYMVRNIVGVLVDVGKEKKTPDELAAIINAKDRSFAGITAPAHGLFLKEVKY